MAKKAWTNWEMSLLLSLALVVAAGGGAAGAQSAAHTYSKQCAACHGRTGNGDGPAGQVMVPPPLPFSSALKGKSDRWMASVITQGGPAVGLSPAMPSHRSLSSSRVKALIQYIKELSS
jgi:high-affinity iron transporter